MNSIFKQIRTSQLAQQLADEAARSDIELIGVPVAVVGHTGDWYRTPDDAQHIDRFNTAIEYLALRGRIIQAPHNEFGHMVVNVSMKQIDKLAA